MVVAPSIGCDRDCEMANGEKLAITIAAPNAVMAVRLVTGPVNHGWGFGIFERCTGFSIQLMSIIGNAALR
jgi:hypothetical protein